MMEYQKEAILISFLKEKEKYKKLAEFIVQLIREDPSSPKESLHTVIYRIKDELRLIEKIDAQNNSLEAGDSPISEKNYKARVGDLLGVRIICLRLSDVVKVEAYLRLLSEEKILCFTKEPEKKRSFILPVNPGESISGGIDRRYSGYSSIHYQVKLGENSDAPSELAKLQAEFQLRTILEEAWGEIDHKYRYIRSRGGLTLPDYIQRGFYNLSVYLQVAALQAEDLCLLAETYRKKINLDGQGNPVAASVDETELIAPEAVDAGKHSQTTALETYLKEFLGFELTARTLNYIERRLDEVGNVESPPKPLQQFFTEDRMLEFKTIYLETLNLLPFASVKERNIDVINALNFAIFYDLQGKRVAQEGLRSVLRWRKESTKCKETKYA